MDLGAEPKLEGSGLNFSISSDPYPFIHPIPLKNFSGKKLRSANTAVPDKLVRNGG